VRRRLRAAALLIALASAAGRAQSDPFAGARFLLGDWMAIDTPSGERGAFTFAFAAQNHVMVRTNEATYDATGDHPASRHDDLLVMYAEGGSLKADYFDSEGHVIRYTVETGEPGVVTFVSEVRQGEPRYRLTYHAGADGVLRGTFEIAAPGAAAAFKPYLAWKARRKN
jgi:hypothetical protein